MSPRRVKKGADQGSVTADKSKLYQPRILFLSHAAPLHCAGLPFPRAQNQESSGSIQQVTLRKALCPECVCAAGTVGAPGHLLVQLPPPAAAQ